MVDYSWPTKRIVPSIYCAILANFLNNLVPMVYYGMKTDVIGLKTPNVKIKYKIEGVFYYKILFNSKKNSKIKNYIQFYSENNNEHSFLYFKEIG